MTQCSAIGRRRGEAGFSYLWVLGLVAFMGLSLTIATEIDSTAVQRDHEKELLSLGRQFRTAIGRYYEAQSIAGKHEYPSSFNDLLKDNRVPGIRRYLRQVFVDPMTGKAKWGLMKIGGRIVGVHSLSNKVPIKQDGFEPENIGLRDKKTYAEWTFVYPSDLILKINKNAAPGEDAAVSNNPKSNDSIQKAEGGQ